MELDKLSLEELKVVATELKVTFTGNILEATLREKIEKFIKDNPSAIKEDSKEDPKLVSAKDQLEVMDKLDAEIAEAEAKKRAIDKSTKIKMTSKFRGVINTSMGVVDFGTTGEATVTARQAKLLASLNGYDIC